MRLISTMAVGFVAALALSACQKSGGDSAVPDDMAMGNANAKVTVIEYASVACPHCATFNNETFPAFKAKYIDTGKVLYVAREALTGEPPGLAVAGFLTARCAGKDKYFKVTEAIYRGQAEMQAPGGQPRDGLLNIARSVGLSEKQFDACINDQKQIDALTARWQKYIDSDHINSTPTFVVNGKMLPPGEATLAALDTAVAEAAGGKAP